MYSGFNSVLQTDTLLSINFQQYFNVLIMLIEQTSHLNFKVSTNQS